MRRANEPELEIEVVEEVEEIFEGPVLLPVVIFLVTLNRNYSVRVFARSLEYLFALTRTFDPLDGFIADPGRTGRVIVITFAAVVHNSKVT